MPVTSVEAAQAWREARQNVAARKPLPDAGPDVHPRDSSEEDHQKARARREIAEANIAEMNEAEKRRQLIRVDAVRTALAGVISATRDSLLQLPARLASVLAVETDPARVHDLLQDELHRALHQITAAPGRLEAVAGTSDTHLPPGPPGRAADAAEPPAS